VPLTLNSIPALPSHQPLVPSPSQDQIIIGIRIGIIGITIGYFLAKND
jgi:hypothetical protein